MYRVFKIAVFLSVFVAVVFLVETGIEHLMSGEDSKAKFGTCYLKIGDVAGFAQTKSAEVCRKIAQEGGGEFIKFSEKEDANLKPYFRDADKNRAFYLIYSNYEEKKNLKDYRFPVRYVANRDGEILSNANMVKNFSVSLCIFLVSFFTVLYFRRKHKFISFPFSLGVALATTSVAVSSSGIIENSMQYYVVIGNSAYLLSSILYSATIYYLYGWTVAAYFYHKFKHEDREITPLLHWIYSLADDVKGSFEH